MRLNSKISITTYAVTYDPNTGTDAPAGTSFDWWADVTQLGEKDVLNFGMDQGNKNYKLLMRSLDLSLDSKITYDSKELKISSVSDYSQGSQYIRVLAVENRN